MYNYITGTCMIILDYYIHTYTERVKQRTIIAIASVLKEHTYI